MIPTIRPACLVLGLVALASPASAQNWYYENGARWSPAGAPVYTAPEYVVPSQRTVIDRTVIPQGNGRAPIVRERVVTDTYNTGVTVAAPAAVAAVTDSYAYVPPGSGYTYLPPAPVYGYTRPVVAERYYGGPRYTETVVDDYAYGSLAPTDAYAYVPNGAGAPRLVTTTTLVRDAAYCARRYRSYDAVSGTFLGYDGLRHACQ